MHYQRQLIIYLTIIFCSLILLSCKDEKETIDFEIENGFQLKLVASEPLIKDPVDLEFNEDGEAMVLEMPGYPLEDKQSRILVLKDKDGDGIYDGADVYAENLQMATSFLPYKLGVLVAAPPYLLYLKDIDKDNKAEVIDTLMGGFSTGNLQHNYNGLTLGLDNWIYAANGGNDGKPYWWNDTISRIDLMGQDFRIHLETKTFERLGESSGGFGLAMDEFGRLFETHNLTHISHLVFPDRYLKGMRLQAGHTLENISNHDENGLARIYPIGEQVSRVNHPEQSGYFSGSCGVTYYGGGELGSEYNHTVWVADVVLNLIHVDKLSANGSSFNASRMLDKRDFLASTDRSFRPVNLTVGPDGCMYIVDIYRKVIEHPEWIPDEIEKNLDLEAGKDKGRIYKITRSAQDHKSEQARFNTTEELINSLDHPNQWLRKTAHRMLLDRDVDETGIAEIVKLLTSENEMARLHAMWLLAIKEKLTTLQLLALMSDNSTGIRENALIIAEKLISKDSEIFTKSKELLNDPDARVRMQAALTISTISPNQFVELKDEILEALTQSSKKEMDRWNISAITLAAQQSTDVFFSRLVKEENVINPTLLSSLALASNHNEEQMKVILNALSASKLNDEIRRDIVHQLAQGSETVSGKSLVPSIQSLEKTTNKGLLSELAALRNRLQLPPSSEFLKFSREALTMVLNSELPDSIRLQQIALIELLPYEEKAEVLYQCLQNTQPLKLQETALRQLSKYREPEIGVQVVKLWKELSPQTRRYASDLLLYNEVHHNALLTGLEQRVINIGEMNFDLERRRTLLWWTDNEDTKRRAEKLFSDAGVTTRKEVIEKMKPALELQGTVDNGERIFASICSNCHVYGSKGNEVGPVLTEINRKSKESIMHDILDPNAAADTRYINHRLETKNGEVHMGIVDAETDQYITLRKMGGEKATVEKSEIKSFHSLGTSYMMEGLENNMTQQEMADLLAFLQNSTH